MDPDDVRRQWTERSGEFSPAYYAYYGPNETSESIRGLLERYVGADAAILELGCGSGRHLSHLHEHGFENLNGVDINEDAFEVMEDVYPDLAARGTFHADAIENVVASFDDGRFDAIFSVETLQHLHPDDERVFEELSRIVDDLLITVENEGGDERAVQTEPAVNDVEYDFPLYYRNWKRVFAEVGFTEIESERGERDTLRVLRRVGGDRRRA
ncbi:class I SAM-dependent methyltransferase [Halegenticoccus tardaugens]|uniref:class I SAM-dependent methyltransferase n=1 Tax=Halegenticoccus tardaugens TaxID=2071624 RepID=UPI00100BAF07|nr:class I SAM-dependent methyltransferase [Halegenticoccus tardaugens]